MGARKLAALLNQKPPYRGLFPSPPLFDRMPTYRTQGKRSLNFLSAEIWNIVYYSTILGRIDLKTGKITGNEKV